MTPPVPNTSLTGIRPSWWNVLWGLPFLIVAVAGLVYAGSLLLDVAGESFIRMLAPGTKVMDLEGGKSYTIFLERESTLDGKVYSVSQPIAGLGCTVRKVSGGEVLPTRVPRSTMLYKEGGRSGRSYLAFDIPADGSYRVACDYAEPGGPRVVVAVGTGFGLQMAVGVMGTIASVLLGFLGAGIPVIIVLLMRERAKKVMQSSSPPGTAI